MDPSASFQVLGIIFFLLLHEISLVDIVLYHRDIESHSNEESRVKASPYTRTSASA
jgi:amino acid permease